MYTCLQDGRLVERTNELDLEDVTIMKEVEMADVFEQEQEMEVEETKVLSEAIVGIWRELEEVGPKKLNNG